MENAKHTKAKYEKRSNFHYLMENFIYFFICVCRYIAEIRNPNSDIPMPDDLKGGKERMVFGNVEAIYEWHRE